MEVFDALRCLASLDSQEATLIDGSVVVEVAPVVFVQNFVDWFVTAN